MPQRYGQKERTLTPVGDNCVRCTLDCGTFGLPNWDHEAFSTSLEINDVPKQVILCGHNMSPKRNSDQPIRTWESIVQNCRICLVKQPDFDTSSKVKSP